MNRKNKFKECIVCGTALISFAAGSLMVVGVTHANETKVDGNRVFELRIYHLSGTHHRRKRPAPVAGNAD